jgi:hypothetical protein
MKSEASGSNKKIPNECHLEHIVMAVFEAVSKAFDSKAYKQQIREGIDNLGRVVCYIVVLNVSATNIWPIQVPLGCMYMYLLAPVYG